MSSTRNDKFVSIKDAFDLVEPPLAAKWFAMRIAGATSPEDADHVCDAVMRDRELLAAERETLVLQLFRTRWVEAVAVRSFAKWKRIHGDLP